MVSSRKRKIKTDPVDKIVEIFSITVIVIMCLLMLYPILNVLAVSVSDYSSYVENPTRIFPDFSNLSFDAFKEVLEYDVIASAYKNTIFVTLVGTTLSVVLTMLTAYPLSKKDLVGKKFFMNMVIFTMIFSGGMIPNFYLMRSLELLDTLWALIMPGMVSAFNVVLVKNFFTSIPESLEESARIDGAGDLKVLFSIVLPLSKPIIATIILFVSVAYWNNYFNAVIYINSRDNWPLQLVMREIIYSATAAAQQGVDALEVGSKVPAITLQYCTMIIAILPIMFVYPFLQKHFAKGVMVGAVKG